MQSSLINTDLKLSEIFCSIFRQFLIPYEITQIKTHAVILVNVRDSPQKHSSLLENSIKDELTIKNFAVLGRHTT